MSYWDHKKELAQKAQAWVKKMESGYAADIRDSVSSSFIWESIPDPEQITGAGGKNTQVILMDANTVDAIFKADGHAAVMNFASYKNPGGKFTEGSSAQEESLCHASTLYPVLKQFDGSYYDYNRKHLDMGLYRDRLLYSKDILFFNGDSKKTADVITCAAPNLSAHNQYYAHDDVVNRALIRTRFRLIYRTAAYFDASVLIAGAWGCGVFRQNPTEVAQEMKQVIGEEQKYFDKIIFAIPAGRNLDAFRQVFEKKKQPWER